MTKFSKNVLERLKLKSKREGRMPSIKDIHQMLIELGIEHGFRKKTNVVEYRSHGNRYVNSRHDGKTGYYLEVGNTIMDTSDSYYSYCSGTYAGELVEIIEKEVTK